MNFDPEETYLTTRELAELLRIKERKVYDMAAAGDVPCVRVVGKLLFPRDEVTRWLNAAHSGPDFSAQPGFAQTYVGSHDPLLEWALGESQCALASFSNGSHDGLERMANNDALVCGLHLHEGEHWNVSHVQRVFSGKPVVLIEFATRVRGLILSRQITARVSALHDLRGLRVSHRQSSAASQMLFESLLGEQNIELSELLSVSQTARTEDDLGMQVFESKADVAFGLQSVAKRLQLEFVPLLHERFDLLVWRKAWFDPAFQSLLGFMRSDAFAARAAEMGGYDISALGTVRYNAPVQ